MGSTNKSLHTDGKKGPRVLFVSPHLPYPKKSVIEDDIDYFYYRNTLAQGVFQLRQWHSWHPLHFLAQNLPVDSVVLENPYWEKFKKELFQGDYDVVAISFTVVLARKVLEMVSWIRDQGLDVEIILGGYGTAIFSENFGIEKEIAARVDHICHGEGIAFMRNYLKTRWGVEGDLPLSQSLIPSINSLFRTRIPLFKQLSFVSSLGCNQGCVFCATSSHFDKRLVDIVTGRELYEIISKEARLNPRIQSAIIYSENFLDNKEKIMEFMEAMMADHELRDRPFLLTVFSSVRSISQYSVQELVQCGIGTIFIGVESFRNDILSGEDISKRGEKNIAELFDQLHESGINTLGSMVMGWDGHTPDNIGAEMDSFVNLNPTFYQIIPLHPMPGTPLWKRIVREKRLIDDYKYEEDGAGRSNFHFKHFTEKEIQSLVIHYYKKLVDEGGPWPFRLFENLVRGNETLSKSTEPSMQARARGYRKMMGPIFPLALMSGLIFSGKGFQKRWRPLFRKLIREKPLTVLVSGLLATMELPIISLITNFGKLRFALSSKGDQPQSLRVPYNNGSKSRISSGH
jgi:Radical SAM superfamily